MLRSRIHATSRRLVLLFAITTLAPAAGLGWLGWRLAIQDRALASQRVVESRNHAADLGAAMLERALGGIEEQLLLPSPVIEEKRHTGLAIVVLGRNAVLD